MRIKLLLSAEGTALVANYFYPLSAVVYKLLKIGSPEFSEFLHNTGYKLNGKSYKLFTYALKLNNFRHQNEKINLFSPEAELLISSPLNEDFITNFILGTFETQSIEIFSSGIRTKFLVKQIESLPEPGFRSEMKFKLLSPVILSTKKIFNQKLVQYYFRHNDDINELNRVFSENLNNKYVSITGSAAEDKEVSFAWDQDYINSRLTNGKRVTRKQTIKQGTPEETDVIGSLIPFTVKGNIDLIKIGYECGFGEKNSLGFGMAVSVGQDDILTKKSV